jgi:gas vesicle protein
MFLIFRKCGWWKGGMKMETNVRKHNYFLNGLLMGAALGGVAGLLFAPKSGRELRADIKTAGQKAFGETKGYIGKASRQVSETRQRARDIWSCIKENRETAPQYRTESVEESVGEA